jgi:hypothetical protein
MNNIRITVKPTPGTTTEEACELRARALRYAIDRYFEKQKPAETSDDDHSEGEAKNGSKPSP